MVDLPLTPEGDKGEAIVLPDDPQPTRPQPPPLSTRDMETDTAGSDGIATDGAFFETGDRPTLKEGLESIHAG